MNKYLPICSVLLMVPPHLFTVYGQGTILFDNRVPGIVDVKFTTFFTDQPVPPGWFGQLFLVDAEMTTVTPLQPITPFRSDSFFSLGYVIPTIVTVPGKPPGSEVLIQMGAFDTPNYLDATGCLSSQVFTVKLGGGADPPAYLIGLSRAGYYGPLCAIIPEPSAISLVLAGAGLLWLGRRRVG